LNSNFRLCDRLHNIGNRLLAVNKHFNSNFKTCNRLHKSCNRLPEEIFRKLFLRVLSFQMVFTWPPKVYIYVTWNTNLLKVFHNKKSYSLKEKKHFILLRISWPIHLQFNKELIECSNCKIYLFQERFILLFFLNSQRGLRDRGSLVVKKSKYKGRIVLVCSELVKGFYKIVELSSGLLGDWT